MEDYPSALILLKGCPLWTSQQHACQWHNQRVSGSCVPYARSGDHHLDPLKGPLLAFSREEEPLIYLPQK
jgi:hypothetical protein